MTSAAPEITACPMNCRVEALSLVLCDIAPSQRKQIAATLLESSSDRAELAGGGLFVAMRSGSLRGAAWGQRQPGNTAVFWPPQLVPGEIHQTAYQLASAVATEFDRAQIAMTQTLLSPGDTGHVEVISQIGFRHLADLLYLSWETGQIGVPSAEESGLDFVSFDPSQPDRLSALVERTYEGSLDCAALNGTRNIRDVIAGYRATGVFHAENWLIAQRDGQDVGVLILADHPQARQWELVYMGLVPEARGCGWGRQIAQYAQLMATRAHVERIVLAVDVVNEPALRLYRAAGFQSWDQRSAYVRFFR
jgi:mycothiol synthase